MLANKKFKQLKITTFGGYFLILIFIFNIILSLFFLTSCRSNVHEFNQTYSFGSVTMSASGLSKKNTDSFFEEIHHMILKVEEETTVHEKSPLSKINGEIGTFELTEHQAFLLRKSLQIKEMTHGSFDPNIYNLVNLWGFSPNSVPKIPSSEEISKDLENSKNSQFALNKNQLNVLAPVSFDFGGIAKGYLVDLIKEIYLEESVTGLINLSGVVCAVGDKGGNPYNIAIKNPRGSEYFATMAFENDIIVTSGDYERYFIENGQRFCHIIDPSTGYPTTSNVISVSIMGKSGLLSDAFCTSLMILSEEKRQSLIEEANLDCLLIYDDFTYETFGNFKIKTIHEDFIAR